VDSRSRGRALESADPHRDTADIGFAGAAELAERLESGELTSLSLTEALIGRIEAIDRDPAGYRLSSIISLAPDPEREAAELDRRRRDGRVASRLHGLGVLVKDNIDTTGPLSCSAGSLALTATTPAVDATVVQDLRAAGLLVLGKTNLSEWANFRSTHSSSGWSAIGGQTRNPHAFDRSPGGSSSGSAAAVAAGLVPFALGTETDGSILCPAALCGVVGLKPTVGLLSRGGVVPISTSQDTVGPIARSVSDAAALLSVLATGRVDPRDSATQAGPTPRVLDYVDSCQSDGLRGARLGVPRQHYFGYHRETDRLIAGVLEALAGAGAEIVDPAEISTAGALASSEDELTVLCCEFKDALESYLRARPGLRDDCPRSLEELIAFNESHAGVELALFGQELLEKAASSGGLADPAYPRARERLLRLSRRDGLDATLDADAYRSRGGAPLDALVVPTMGPAWLIDHVNGDAPTGAGYQVAAVAGYPAITVPVGAVAGLPVGLSFLGRPFSEPTLIRLAFGLEQLISCELRPRWAASAEIGGPVR
jgi:amidase